MGVEDTNTENNDQPSKPDVANLWSHGPLQGALPLTVTLKDVKAQKDDRLLIDALLDYSEEEEDKGLIGTLFCGDWRDAVTGWKLTRPNVKYAWSEKAIKERRHKNVNHTKKKQQEEQTWKNKIEPGTYRYNPDCGTQFRPDQVEKRQVHPSLQHHIDKVREHLERTLMKQQVLGEIVQERKKLEPLPRIVPKQTSAEVDKKGGGDSHNPYLPVSKPLGSKSNSNDHKNGEYIVKMVPKGRRHSLEDDGIISNSEIVDGDAHFHRNGAGQQSDTKLLLNGKKHHTWHRQYQNPQSTNNKAPVDLVTALGQKLNEILLEDKLKSLGGIASLPRKIQKSSLFNSNSSERFPASELTPASGDQTLNPLMKVTPHQRQIHDDNEVVAITSSRVEKTGTANSTSSHVTSLYGDVLREDPSNKDFINVGISGQNLQSKSDKKQTGKRNCGLGSNKLHKLPLTHSKTESSEKTGDDMHHGMMDRESAAAVAIALMPGVRGRNIEVPNV